LCRCKCQTDLNRCDNSFTVEAELHLTVEDGRIAYTTDVTLNDEAEAYVWATVDEALRLPVEPYTERAIRAYLAQQAEK
jgi:hypothetical protein